MISVVLTYVNDKFMESILKHIFKELISQKDKSDSKKKKKNSNEDKIQDWKFIKEVKGHIQAKN